MRQIFFGIALAALPLPALAQGNFSSPAQVVDGDSLSVSGMSIRLFGIDAPEMQQDCKKNGEAWKCGEEAKRQLQTLVADSRVECRGKGMDEYGRTVAVCTAGNLELNKTMVEQGWATAFRKYSDAYVAQETQAKSAGLGIWASEFVLPEDYRNTHRSPGPEQGQSSWAPRPVRQSRAATSGCAIKGNRSRKGEPIYHLPGMPYYDTTVPEQTFCSETEAQAAGYRRSRARW